MATVLRNPNSNKIKVIYFSKPQYIRKITSNKRYFNYLQNEIRGLQWYQKYSKNKNVLIKYNKNSNFFFLDIKIFKEKKNIFYKSIEENSFLISKAIDHYLKIWPNKTHVRCHGDLTIDNIIFNENKIKFIDWELSGLSNEPWGYDLIYLLISSIYFPYEIKKTINDSEKNIFIKLWTKLRRLNISYDLLNDPLSFIKKVHKKKRWREAIKDHPKKLYSVFINKDFEIILKELIN